MRHLLGMSNVGSRRYLDVVHVEKSRYASKALALVTAEIPGVLKMQSLRLYRRNRDGKAFVSGAAQPAPDGRRRSGVTLYGSVQHICTALAREELRQSVLEDYDPSEAPEEHLWLFDSDHDALYGELPRNEGVVFDTLERVDGLRESLLEPGTWIFRLTVLDEIVIEHCEIADLGAAWPTISTPRVPRSHYRYADIRPEAAQRIAVLVAERLNDLRPQRPSTGPQPIHVPKRANSVLPFVQASARRPTRGLRNPTKT